MLFNSYEFPIFLVLVLGIFHLLPMRFRTPFLVTASYIFYGFWNWKFCSLLFISTIVDYYCGLNLHTSAPSRKKFLLLSLATNLGILGFFKYFNFFIESFVELFAQFGIQASVPTLEIILPVGISFYTFQTLSYTIDIYRGQIKPTRSFLQFALYVSFFPQLVAGPIERAKHLLPQLAHLKNANSLMWKEGLSLVVMGYLKKVVVGDQLGAFVDPAFSNWDSMSSVQLLEGLCLFSLQIYFDFSGYSDIARGVSRWFGIDLMVNFKQPYFSTSITEFWRRWHISLSNWLKEYLYIPLGGNRKGSKRTYINLMLTMLLGGLWHGANLSFVIWGAMHGVYLAVHKFALGYRKPKEETTLFQWRNAPLLLVKLIFTQILVLITWLPFRADSFSHAWGYGQRMIAGVGDWNWGTIGFIGLLYGLLFAIDFPVYKSKDEYFIWKKSRTVRWTYFFIALSLILFFCFQQKEARPFIYFQF